MSKTFLAATLLAVLFFLTIVIVLLRQKKLYLKYALLWLLTGVVMIVVAVFPGILTSIFNFLGIQVYSNGIFAVLFLFFMIILMSLTSIVSILNAKIRTLTQEMAILEKKVRDMEDNTKE